MGAALRNCAIHSYRLQRTVSRRAGRRHPNNAGAGVEHLQLAAGGSHAPAIACPRNLARTISFCIEVACISPTCAVRTSQLGTSHMRETFGPAGEQDARAAYLFFCPSTNRYGVTLDKFGSNLPQQGGDAGWQLQAEFPLGIHEALPAPMDPEPVLRGIMAVGYFVWRAGPVRNPSGTSQ